MRFSFFLLLVLLSLSAPTFGVTLDDLEYRKGVYYQNNSDAPYTGPVSGRHQGSFVDGIREGSWISKWRSGEVSSQGLYKNGKKDGVWKGYTKNGDVDTRLTGTYDIGMRISE